MVEFFFLPNTWQKMIFLIPLELLIPKIPFSFFCRIFFLCLGHLRVWGSVSVGFWEACQLSLLGGGVLARGLHRPPPPPQS